MVTAILFNANNVPKIGIFDINPESFSWLVPPPGSAVPGNRLDNCPGIADRFAEFDGKGKSLPALALGHRPDARKTKKQATRQFVFFWRVVCL
ncbi:MAG TPA: hypothetical protein VFB38_09885 [Chthonomonadaceae bacterium]|nr:hypothetical protein [Chthonomonadaceae bacterium]